jgi:hypothetical protein
MGVQSDISLHRCLLSSAVFGLPTRELPTGYGDTTFSLRPLSRSFGESKTPHPYDAYPPPAAELLTQKAIFVLQVLDELLLVAVDPAGHEGDEDGEISKIPLCDVRAVQQRGPSRLYGADLSLHKVGGYWSCTAGADAPASAWCVDFLIGVSDSSPENEPWVCPNRAWRLAVGVAPRLGGNDQRVVAATEISPNEGAQRVHGGFSIQRA